MAKKKSASKSEAKKGDTGIPVSDTEAKEGVAETKEAASDPKGYQAIVKESQVIAAAERGRERAKNGGRNHSYAADAIGDEMVEPDGSEVVEDVAPEAEIPPPPLDTIHEPAQTAAQIEADKLFEKGVAEVETAFQPFIEPSADDIQAEVLGRIETARHEHTEALAAFVEDNPGIELDRSADHAKIAARTR